MPNSGFRDHVTIQAAIDEIADRITLNVQPLGGQASDIAIGAYVMYLTALLLDFHRKADIFEGLEITTGDGVVAIKGKEIPMEPDGRPTEALLRRASEGHVVQANGGLVRIVDRIVLEHVMDRWQGRPSPEVESGLSAAIQMADGRLSADEIGLSLSLAMADA